MQPYIRPRDILDQKCTDDGLPDGDPDASGNHSGAPFKLFVKPALTETFEIYRFGMFFTTTTAFEGGDYGDGAVLTNGIKVTIEGEPGDDDLEIHDFLSGGTVKSNAAWETILDVNTIIERTNTPALFSGDDLFVASLGAPIRISGSQNQRFVVTLEDDFVSRVLTQEFYISGQKVV